MAKNEFLGDFNIEGPFDNSGYLTYFSGKAAIRGWVATAKPGMTLKLYKSGKFVAEIVPVEERQDVGAIFKEATGPFGFNTEVVFSDLDRDEAGTLELSVKLEDGTRVLSAIELKAMPGTPTAVIHLDNLTYSDGRIALSTPNIHISGWAICQAKISRIEARFGDDQVIPVQFGVSRSDVYGIHPNNPNGLQTGLSLFVPELSEGKVDLDFCIVTESNHRIHKVFPIDVVRNADATVKVRERPFAEKTFWSTLPASAKPSRWVVCFVGDADPDLIRQCIGKNAELSGASTIVPDAWAAFADLGPSVIRFGDTAELGRILGELEKDTLVTFARAGDQIEETAAAMMAVAWQAGAEFYYWDEVALTERGPETIRKVPGAPFVSELFSRTAGRGCALRVTSRFVDNLNEYGLEAALKLHTLASFYDHPEKCIHIPEALTSYEGPVEVLPLSTVTAINRFLDGVPGRFGTTQLAVSGIDSAAALKLVRDGDNPLVSIIIPTIAKNDRITKCLQDLRHKTSYKTIEVVVLDHTAPTQDNWEVRRRIRDMSDFVLPMKGAFNWSKFNNMGAVISTGDVLLFLNDDVEVVNEDWLEQILGLLNFDRVGAVGPRLLFEGEESVQSQGVSLIEFEGWARNDFAFSNKHIPLAGGINLIPRNCTALLGAAIVTPRDLFFKLGGFDEKLALTFNDLDYGLRVRDEGYQVAVTPFANLVHHEKNSRAELTEKSMEPAYWEKWHLAHPKGDPYWHPAYERSSGFYKVDPEPVEPVWNLGVSDLRSNIKSILLLRLDHVGDFVQTLSAFARLRKSFPDSRIDIVVGGWNLSLAQASGLFDRVYTFNFYSSRSGDGRAVTLDAAGKEVAQLVGDEVYDLAIDFRADGDTRALLNSLQARFRAGFSDGMHFPWLDVSVEWDRNLPRWRKTLNGSGLLVRLVDAIENAFPETVDASPVWPEEVTSGELPRDDYGTKPIVAIHPFAGNDIKMWPDKSWLDLIDMIIERGAQVVMVGTKSDLEANAELVKALEERGVRSEIGKLSLLELLKLLKRSACFVGCDSGPKHLAASVRVPTIGIQSGFVDPVVWSPAAFSGLSVVKRVACAPCYLDKIEDCMRDHACMKKILPRNVFTYVAAMLEGKIEHAQPMVRRRLAITREDRREAALN